VATNACLDEMRRRSRRPDPGLPEHEVVVAGGAPELDTQIADQLDIDEALQQIPVEFRAPVVLRDLAGLDYAEIAEVLDLPPGTVRSRISRGRAALARHLGGNQDPIVERTRESP
jgi:RNA polymerase sigma-70 factor (ECF subfamily)